MAEAKRPFVSDKLAKHRKTQARVRRVFIAVLVVIVIGLTGFLTYGNRFQIVDATVTGTKAVSGDAVRSTVLTSITGKRALIIPRRNMFFYSQKHLKAILFDAYPRLSDISIVVKNHVLLVTVVEREPAYLWCGNSIPVNREASFASTCYFVDATGFIFSLAPQFSDAVYLKIFTSLSEGVDPVKQYAMDANILSRVATFSKNIASPQFKPSAFSITSDGDALIFLFRDSDILPAIRYNPLHDPLTIVSAFKVAVSTEPLKTKIANDLANLEYIDLRFPNKVFYKFRDELSKQQDNAKYKYN